MSINPYPALPRDRTGIEMQDCVTHASVKAIYASENSAASSVISVTHDTTFIEVAAVGGPAVVRFVRTNDTQASVVSAAAGANFSFVVPTGMVRKAALPIETLFQAPSSMVGANRLNGLYQRVAIKSIGTASVLLTEY